MSYIEAMGNPESSAEPEPTHHDYFQWIYNNLQRKCQQDRETMDLLFIYSIQNRKDRKKHIQISGDFSKT